MKTGIKELLLWWNNKNTYRQKQYSAQEIIDKAISLLAEERAIQDKFESLAELADRKGFIVFVIQKGYRKGYFWLIDIGRYAPKESMRFEGKTYTECESKARQYLEGLYENPCIERIQ